MVLSLSTLLNFTALTVSDSKMQLASVQPPLGLGEGKGETVGVCCLVSIENVA